MPSSVHPNFDFFCVLAYYYAYLLIPHFQYNSPIRLICLVLLPCFCPQLLINSRGAVNVTANSKSNLPYLMHQPLNAKHSSQLSSYPPILSPENRCPYLYVSLMYWMIGYTTYCCSYHIRWPGFSYEIIKS